MIFLWANPLVRRVLLYLAIAAAAAYALRLYSNRVYTQGLTAGRQAAAVELEAGKQAEWQAERDKLATEAESLSSARIKLQAETSEIRRARAAIDQTLEQIRAASTAGKGVIGEKVAAVPATELDATLRTVSAALGPPK